MYTTIAGDIGERTRTVEKPETTEAPSVVPAEPEKIPA